MAAPGEKSLFVSEYHVITSLVAVQSACRAQYANDQPTDKTIRAWYKQFTETGCLCKHKSSGRLLTAEYRTDVFRFSRGAHIEHL
jgi:hypothetical protein